MQYYDSQNTREPARIDIANLNSGSAETWIFWEFDDTPQDANLFVIDSTILAQCN